MFGHRRRYVSFIPFVTRMRISDWRINLDWLEGLPEAGRLCEAVLSEVEGLRSVFEFPSNVLLV